MSHPFGTLARVTHDDDARARARALEENRRRSEVMAEAQRYGPPIGHRVVTDWSQQDDTERDEGSESPSEKP